MDIFISLLVFGMAVFLFFMATNKIKNLKGDIIIDDARKELEGLITAFNGAASRNIELLESKIAELQGLLKKANDKMVVMDERIGRINKPIVIEKIVEKRTPPPAREKKKEIAKPAEPAGEMPRTEKLKYYLKTGKTREELLGIGFLENEINLISFLLRKGGG
jgi:uncharacterized coiled-coil protein SlyX